MNSEISLTPRFNQSERDPVNNESSNLGLNSNNT